MARSSSVQNAPVFISDPGDAAVVQAVASGGIQIYGLVLFVSGPTTLVFKNGTTVIGGPCPITATTAVPIILPLSDDPWFTVDAGNAFQIGVDTVVDVGGMVYYTAGG